MEDKSLKITNLIKEHKAFVCFLVVSVVLITLCNSNSFIYKVSRATDAGIYFNTAKGMLQGDVLYRDIFDHKGPFIFFIYMIYNLIFPCKLYGAYIMDIICFSVINLFTYKLFKLKFSKEAAVFFTAIYFFIVMWINDSNGGPEIFAVLLESVIIYWAYAGKINERKYLVFFGMMTGVLLMSKFTLAVFPFVMFFLFIWENTSKKAVVQMAVKKADASEKISLKTIAENIGILVGTMLCPVLISIIYFVSNNAFKDFVDTYIFVNKNYAKISNDTMIILAVALVVAIIVLLVKRLNVREKIIAEAIILQYMVIILSKSFKYTYLPITIIFVFIVLKLKGKRIAEKIDKKLLTMMMYEAIIVISIYYGANQIPAIKDNYTLKYASAGSNDIALLCTDGAIFTEEEKAPNFKYFFTPNIGYNEKPEMWHELYAMVEECKPYNIYVPYAGGDEIFITKLFMKSSEEEIYKILDELNKNYKCTDKYEGNLYRWERK